MTAAVGTGALALPPRQELMTAASLLPVLDRLDEARERARDAESIQAVLEGYLMIEAVASERRLREQANRAEGGVTVLRTRLGALTPDGRRGGPGRGKHIPRSECVLSPYDLKQRHANKKLANVGEPKVAEVVADLVAEGERPTPAKVIEAAKRPHKYEGRPRGSNDWYTPANVLALAREAMGGSIDLDPASCPVANEIVGAADIFTAEDDGLRHPWRCNRLWLNPPYIPPEGVPRTEWLQSWVAKLASEHAEGRTQQAVLLLNAVIEADYCQEAIRRADAVCLWRGRMAFHGPRNPDGRGSALMGQVLLYFGPGAEQFARAFSPSGVVVCRYEEGEA